jgi:hypothetical protein
MNRYLYGAADPANLVDPTGRTAITEYLGVAWIGTAAANGVALGFIKLVEQNAKAAGQMILGNAAEIYFNRAVIAAAISQFFPVAAIYGMGGTIGCMLALSTPDAFAALVSIKGPNIPPQVLLWYCFPQPLSSG